ncbi:MAG: hypothetical protein N2315_00475 [Thermanaerothrix sp.]|nr:hypothetical protein [Thermanaerothrix sp.]
MADKSASASEKPKRARRPRRSPEELLADLERRRLKLEKRLMKKNQETVMALGYAFLKAVGKELSSMDPSESSRIISEPDYALHFVRGLMGKN